MKNLLRVTLAATMLLAGSGLAQAQDDRGAHDGRNFERHGEYRGEPQRREGWEHHREAEYRGGYGGPGYAVPVYAAPVYAAPVYEAPAYAAPAYGYGYGEPEREDEGANVAGAVVVGAVATGILAAILLGHH